MSGPLGVPDFLALVGGLPGLQERLASGIPPLLSELDCEIVAQLFAARPRTLSALAVSLGWTETAVGSRIARLRKTGAVIETPKGTYLRHRALKASGSVYAIEAKIRDWNKAVRQARGYRTWANNYVLVLGPLGSQAINSATKEAASDHAGLYVDGHWVLRPLRHSPEAARALLGFEHLVAALENYQPSLAIN
jgi:DNA-binding Lrp family transcriptional regulator